MAGSYNMLIHHGEFNMDMIENLGDAYEALEQCVGMIQILSEGNQDRIIDARKRYREGLASLPNTPDDES